jgi:dTDP-glucose 4,6-dehydratase
MTMAYHRYHGVDTKIVRIFNTYGPRMRVNDGARCRVHVASAAQRRRHRVRRRQQTRSFTYITDLVDGIIRLMLSKEMIR